jgi:capsule polysaccharide export protein KpsE/RkpR
MSLYREPGQARRRRRAIVAGAAATLVMIAVLVVVLAGGGGPPTTAERAQAARSAAAQALDGLELLQIEYGQAVRDGRVVAPTEYDAAKADVDRARAALTAHREDVAVVDPAAPAKAQAALARVSSVVQQRGEAARLRQAVDRARAVITPLTR